MYQLWGGGGYGVDIFLILSGFGITYSRLKKDSLGHNENWISFYKRRFLRIVPTYLAIAAAFYAISCNSVAEFFYNLSLLNFIREGKRDFWYIFAILICYLLFPVFYELRKKIDFRILLFVFAFIGGIITLIIMVSLPGCYDNWEIALWRFPCFWMGCYYGVLIYTKKVKEFYILTGIFTLLGIVLCAYFGLIRNVFIFLSPCVMLILCFLIEVLHVEGNVIGKILSCFGNVSLELYLIHVSFGIFIAEYIYSKTGSYVIRLGTYFGVSIILAFFLHYSLMVTKKCFAGKHTGV